MDKQFSDFIKTSKPKYAHIFRYCGIFSNSFLKYINNHKEIFDTNKTVFILNSDTEVKVAGFKIFCTKEIEHCESEYINFLSDYVDVVFAHYLDIWSIIKLSKQSQKKIIWRTWGNDLYKNLSYSPSIKLKIKHILEKTLWFFRGRNVVNNFKYIGISSSECDLLILKKMHISTKTCVLPYPVISDRTFFPEKIKPRDKKITVMVGHSSNSSLKHLKWIKKFAHYSNDFKLFIPLSYGRDGYRTKVINELNSYNNLEYKILEEEIPVLEYENELNKVDIAIFDVKNQMGLGNIIILLGLGKTIYLNRKSVVYKTLIDKGIQIKTTNELKKININTIRNHISDDKTKGIEYSNQIYNNDFVLKKWTELFTKL